MDLEEWPVYTNYLEDIKFLKKSFHNSNIIHIRKMYNLMTDILACSAKNLLSFVVHIDVELPVWFMESSDDDKKKKL